MKDLIGSMRARHKLAALGLCLLAIALCAVFAAMGYGELSLLALSGSGLSLAAVVQTTYTETMPVGAAGMPATTSTQDIDTRIVENSNGVPFGRAVGRGTYDTGCRLGAAAAADFLGVSVRDVTLAPQTADSDYVDEYQQGANCGVMVRGDIWVEVGGAVVDGGDVTFDTLTGVLSSAAASGTQFAVSGARWMTTQATTGGLAKLRLSGHLPSA